MRKLLSRLLLVTLIINPVILPSPALSEVRKERVQFKAGTEGTTIQGQIKGEQIVQYLIRANAGQTLSVAFFSDNGGSSFNIYAPGKVPGKDGAMVIGENVGNTYEGSLPATGDYIIQVGLNRNAVRNNEVANYRLKIYITGGNKNDAKVPGTNYHATGNVTCSMGDGKPDGSCPFGVIRRGNGSADVTITKPDGRKRVIFFENGTAIGYDVSQADPGEFRVNYSPGQLHSKVFTHRSLILNLGSFDK